MKWFINTYKPLCGTPAGVRAVGRHGLPPFVDASCRREPDFEAEPASISALCRAGMFAPRLHQGDVVVYVTKKGKYPGMPKHAYRVVAVLQVITRFESHEDARDWYEQRGLPLPSDCLVGGNDPLPLEYTSEPGRDLDAWDEVYQQRVREHAVFLACKKLHVELHDPGTLTSDAFVDVFGHVPGTRTQAAQDPAKVRLLLSRIGIRISALEPVALEAAVAAYPVVRGAPTASRPRLAAARAAPAAGTGGCSPPRGHPAARSSPPRRGGC
jgi:hypothetical protein